MQSLKSECVSKQHTSAVQCRFCPQSVFFAEDRRIPLADVIFDTAVHNFWSLRGWSWGLNESVGDTWGHSTVRYKNQTDHCNMLMVSYRNEKESEVLILVSYVDSTNWWGSTFHQTGIWFLRYPLSGYSCHKRRNGPLPLLWGRLVRWPWESEEGPYSRLYKMVEFITNHIVIYMYLTWLFNTYYFFLWALIQTR